MRSLILAALLAAGPAIAEDAMVARSGNDTVRIWNLPCVHGETLARIQPQFRDQFHKARAQVGGQDFFACWILEGDQVFILYEDGDKGLIPMSNFKPDGA